MQKSYVWKKNKELLDELASTTPKRPPHKVGLYRQIVKIDSFIFTESHVSLQDYLMRHTNHCGSERSKIRTRTAVVTFIMANIGITRAEVTGRDVQTYFSYIDRFDCAM